MMFLFFDLKLIFGQKYQKVIKLSCFHNEESFYQIIKRMTFSKRKIIE